jgi:adenylate cyclase class 2
MENYGETNITTQEVEKRALLKESEYEEISKKLEELDAKLIKKVNLNDVYFCPIKIKSFAEIEMNTIGSYSLRLREQHKDNNNEITLNVKVINQEGDHNSWTEYETEVDSLENMNNILRILGFKPFCTINKSRVVYKLKDIEISLENIADFGLGIEVEIKTSLDKVKDAKTRIDMLFKKLNISLDQIVPKSLTNVIMAQKSKF